MSNYARKRPGMNYGSDREYHAIESMGHKTARPILTICLERGNRGLLSYGVSTDLCRQLTAADRAQIVETVRRILEERK